MLLYSLHDGYEHGWEQSRRAAEWLHLALENPFSPMSYHPSARQISAFCKLFSQTKLAHERPDFGIEKTQVGGWQVDVHEEVFWHSDFCDILHFQKSRSLQQRKVLLVAPLSGHFATLLRGTVETMLPDFDVYITDWKNARDIPISKGSFDLDDEINLLMHVIGLLGSELHVVAVCQPAVPVLCAVSLLASQDPSKAPASMTLIGGPIDARVNPTAVNKVSMSHSMREFKACTCPVPQKYRGHSRFVYPGFMQIAAFIAMNWQKHTQAFEEMFGHLARGNAAGSEKTRKFYEEYLTVSDLPAEFYLQTVERVFQKHLLPMNKFIWHGTVVEPAAIERTDLLVIEGENDDICGPGQTEAALDLCTNAKNKVHHLQRGAGHYGTFNGSRWQNEIYPVLKKFIQGA